MKQLTIIGIILLVFSVMLVYESSLQFEGSVSNSALQSVVVGPHASAAMPFQVSNGTAVGTFYYANTSNLTYYLLDSQAFSGVSSMLNSTGLLTAAYAYNGMGAYEIIYSNSSGIFPSSLGRLPKGSYFYNGTSIFPNGTYYNVFQNFGSQNTLVYYSIIQKPQLSTTSTLFSSGAYGILAALLFLAGIGMIGYSLLARREPKQVSEADVDALYASYDNGARKARKGARKKHGKGK